MSEDDGRCPNCGEDEMDGARCYYCGFHDYDCELPECRWCADRDTDGSPEGPDPKGLDGEAARAGAAPAASPKLSSPYPDSIHG